MTGGFSNTLRLRRDRPTPPNPPQGGNNRNLFVFGETGKGGIVFLPSARQDNTPPPSLKLRRDEPAPLPPLARQARGE